MIENIHWDDFKKLDIRVGTIIEANHFPEATKPAYQLKIDLGSKIGIKKSSAQITELYSIEDLLGRQVLVVVNLFPKKIGPFISDCLITGFYTEDKSVVLAIPERKIQNGSLLS
jgi:tRNA-binding protein